MIPQCRKCAEGNGNIQRGWFLDMSDKALTLDELREMDGEPVWVVYDEDEGIWALVEVCEESIFLTNNIGGRTEYADEESNG